MSRKPEGTLRSGWSTGACATAAAKSAYIGLLSGSQPSSIQIDLPKGRTPVFEILRATLQEGTASATVVKDAGDDPDVTHGAEITVTISLSQDEGVFFKAGKGVGTVTKPGLPIPAGEPAINPMPRRYIAHAIKQVAEQYSALGNVVVEISILHGEKLAKKTWNPRLGIIGGLSVLGTTGVVTPYSCSAWIDSIHRGIDVARATATPHVAACTGSTSEKLVQSHYQLGDTDMIDMGDFVGATLKYLKRNPLPRFTLGGGFAKLCKLAQGHMDLHSKRSEVDFDWLRLEVIALSAQSLHFNWQELHTAMGVLELCQKHNIGVADHIARLACQQVLKKLNGKTTVDVLVVNRAGELVGQYPASTSVKLMS
jgi:cobalt-precorrin-5B (C1)-methyltransferase